MFGRLLDKKGALWVMLVCGFTIPVLPLGWIFITAPWQVGIINTLGGFIWAGYNLANFNRQFRRRTGLAPVGYRREHGAGENTGLRIPETG